MLVELPRIGRTRPDDGQRRIVDRTPSVGGIRAFVELRYLGFSSDAIELGGIELRFWWIRCNRTWYQLVKLFSFLVRVGANGREWEFEFGFVSPGVESVGVEVASPRIGGAGF